MPRRTRAVSSASSLSDEDHRDEEQRAGTRPQQSRSATSRQSISRQSQMYHELPTRSNAKPAVAAATAGPDRSDSEASATETDSDTEKEKPAPGGRQRRGPATAPNATQHPQPVQQQRRSKLWWWIGGGVVALLLTIVFVFLYKKDDTDSESDLNSSASSLPMISASSGSKSLSDGFKSTSDISEAASASATATATAAPTITSAPVSSSLPSTDIASDAEAEETQLVETQSLSDVSEVAESTDRASQSVTRAPTPSAIDSEASDPGTLQATETHKPSATATQDAETAPKQTQTVQATWFAADNGITPCLSQPTDGDFVVHISPEYYGDLNSVSRHCGQWLSMWNPESNHTVKATVEGICAQCGGYELDLSQAAFYGLEQNMDIGIINVQWWFTENAKRPKATIKSFDSAAVETAQARVRRGIS